MLKTILKNAVKEDQWLFMSWYRKRFGTLSGTLSYLSLRKSDFGRAPNPFGREKVHLRPGTTDQNVYDEIFFEKEYDMDLGNPKFIIDAGAHIGLASVYFASRYPQATVIAIEPEPSNYAVLRKNTENFPNIKTIQAGIWSKKTHLRIENPYGEASNWSFIVSEDPSGTGIPALGIQDILDDFNAGYIDVLKMDIEGSEIEVMEASQPWIDAVGILITELHDKFRPGCRDALDAALSQHSYDVSRSGESIIVRNIKRNGHR